MLPRGYAAWRIDLINYKNNKNYRPFLKVSGECFCLSCEGIKLKEFKKDIRILVDFAINNSKGKLRIIYHTFAWLEDDKSTYGDTSRTWDWGSECVFLFEDPKDYTRIFTLCKLSTT